MITITSEEMKDYRICPRLYDFRKGDELGGVHSKTDVLRQRYENTLLKVLGYFFYKKQSGIIVSYGSLLKRWDKLWFGKTANISDIISAENPVKSPGITNYASLASQVLRQFWDEYAEDERDPFIMGEPYAFQLSADIRIGGEFDIVLRNARTKQIDIIKWDLKDGGTSRVPSDLDIPLFKMAFDNRYGYGHNAKFYRVKLPGKTEEVTITEEDLNEVEYLAYDMAEAVVNLPRKHKNSFCYNCPYQAPCNKWALTKEDLKWKKDRVQLTLRAT